jgi:hypothetical protein
MSSIGVGQEPDLATPYLLIEGQDLGGWNGGAEVIPARVAVAGIGDTEFKAGPVANVAGRVTTVSGLGAQAGDRVQSGEGVGAWAALPWGMER